MWRLLSFSITEGIHSLWRSRMLNLLSVGTIMFAMFILGSFIFVAINLKKITVDWQDQIQFNIFLIDGIDESQLNRLRSYLMEHPSVDEANYLSKDAARKRFEQDFTAYAEVAAALTDNPFPASFQVRLVKGVGREAFDGLKSELEKVAGIDDIYYDEEVFRRLDFFAGLIQLAGYFFGGIMIFSSIFSISNVLKLTFFTRREEVDIMKLVGASRGYIRGPFIIEGTLQGFLGAVIGLSCLYLGYLGLDFYLVSRGETLIGQFKLVFLPLSWLALLALAGGISGLLGSLFSLNQFLEEHISYQ